jgi:hypothetical protein
VDTPVTYFGDSAYKNETYDPDDSPNVKIPFTTMKLYVRNTRTLEILLNWVPVPVNASGTKVEIDLAGINKTGDTYFDIIGNSPDAIQTYQSRAKITILAERNDTGSMARIDRLYGGIEIHSPETPDWRPIFPISFYTSWDWISSGIANQTDDLANFRDLGFNIIHPVPPGGSDPFDENLFEEFLTICDDIELYVMYDMRHTYQNLTSMSIQLARLQSHPSLLLYYTADEPDGWTDPVNATKIAYDHIHSVDPYHPTSLVLNCADFFFDTYTRGADIILEDTYPIIKNSSFSIPYNTACNSTYGDCGCDNCHVNNTAYPEYVKYPFKDVSDRVDNFYQYQKWTAATPHIKSVWGVPQAFYDEGTFWSRWAEPKESALMILLRIVHGAKGIVGWLYPTSPSVESVTSDIAQILTQPTITALLLGTPRQPLTVYAIIEETIIEAAAWVGERQMLVVLAYQGVKEHGAKLSVWLPERVKTVETLYGPKSWMIVESGTMLGTAGLQGLQANIFLAEIDDDDE